MKYIKTEKMTNKGFYCGDDFDAVRTIFRSCHYAPKFTEALEKSLQMKRIISQMFLMCYSLHSHKISIIVERLSCLQARKLSCVAKRLWMTSSLRTSLSLQISSTWTLEMYTNSLQQLFF